MGKFLNFIGYVSRYSKVIGVKVGSDSESVEITLKCLKCGKVRNVSVSVDCEKCTSCRNCSPTEVIVVQFVSNSKGEWYELDIIPYHLFKKIRQRLGGEEASLSSIVKSYRNFTTKIQVD